MKSIKRRKRNSIGNYFNQHTGGTGRPGPHFYLNISIAEKKQNCEKALAKIKA
jgi:hypothetical protein